MRLRFKKQKCGNCNFASSSVTLPLSTFDPLIRAIPRHASFGQLRRDERHSCRFVSRMEKNNSLLELE
jgi:hypothetical protein